MDLFEAMEHRHAVRSYEDRPIAPEAREALLACIAQCNREGGFTSSLFWMSPGDSGASGPLREVLRRKKLHRTDRKEVPEPGGSLRVLRGEDRTAGPAAGSEYLLGRHDVQQGQDRLSDRPGREALPGDRGGLRRHPGHRTPGQAAGRGVQGGFPVPDWFQRGVRAALLAPTAMNQQKFAFTLQGGSVAAKAGTGFYTKVDLGIAKYHFEIGAGTAQFRWAP